MKKPNHTEHPQPNSTPGKKQWQSPELVIIDRHNIDQPGSTWPQSAEGSQQIQAPALQVRVKKAIRTRRTGKDK